MEKVEPYLDEHRLKLFEAKINYNGRQTEYVSTRCHEWMGSKTPKGYGTFNTMFEGESKIKTAHVVAKKHYHGWRPDMSIPWRLRVCRHMCHNKSCVNPEHIVIGTARENNEDRRITGSKLGAVGEANSHNKYPEKLMQKVKYEVFSPDWKHGDSVRIANKYRVSVWVVRNIKRESNWKHLPRYPGEDVKRRLEK